MERPKITPRSSTVYPLTRATIHAASHFRAIMTPMITAATSSVRRPSRMTDASTSIPTCSRKKGTKNALPANSIRESSVPPSGISRLSARPPTNAPRIGAMSSSAATLAAPKKTTATKRNSK